MISKFPVLERPRPGPRPGRPRPPASHENKKFAVLGCPRSRPIPIPGSPRPQTSSRTAGTSTVPSCVPLFGAKFQNMVIWMHLIHDSWLNLYQRIFSRNFDLNYLTFLFIIDQQSRVFKSN